MLVLALILSVAFNIALIYGVANLIGKLEIFEDYFDQLQVGLNKVLTQIRAVDIQGAFEADDEVGDVFKTIQGLVESLDAFMSQGENGQT